MQLSLGKGATSQRVLGMPPLRRCPAPARDPVQRPAHLGQPIGSNAERCMVAFPGVLCFRPLHMPQSVVQGPWNKRSNTFKPQRPEETPCIPKHMHCCRCCHQFVVMRISWHDTLTPTPHSSLCSMKDYPWPGGSDSPPSEARHAQQPHAFPACRFLACAAVSPRSAHSSRSLAPAFKALLLATHHIRSPRPRLME